MARTEAKIRVLVIDDSALMRAMLTRILEEAGDIEVVGAAPDPIVAREMIKQLNPDVLTLDVEMPRMDGISFLERLMRLRPTPVVMISSLTQRGSDATLQALELGAVDFIAKPSSTAAHALQEYAGEIHAKVRAAHGARRRIDARRQAPSAGGPRIASDLPRLSASQLADRIVCIGASTGGTEAIKEILVHLPAEMPGIVMAQHMPALFTPSFAKRLDSLSPIHVKEAEHNERILPGHAYLAPGHSHLRIRRSGAGFYCELDQGPPVNRHRPSVDVLFDSAAAQAGARALGVILTGMGKDGAQGLLNMRHAGAWTIGQDQESCVVYGMPREAASVGALAEVVALNEMPARIMAALRTTPTCAA